MYTVSVDTCTVGMRVHAHRYMTTLSVECTYLASYPGCAVWKRQVWGRGLVYTVPKMWVLVAFWESP